MPKTQRWVSVRRRLRTVEFNAHVKRRTAASLPDCFVVMPARMCVYGVTDSAYRKRWAPPLGDMGEQGHYCHLEIV